jgi:hypothetical protein
MKPGAQTTVIESGWHGIENRTTLGRMSELIKLIFRLVVDLIQSRAAVPVVN